MSKRGEEMIDFIIKRPLFTACGVAIAVAIVCGFLTASAMAVLGVAMLFSFLFIIPFKTPLKSAVVVTAVTCITIIISNIFYYNFSYKPVLEYEGVSASVECEVIKPNRNGAVVLCQKVTCDDIVNTQKFRADVIISDDVKLVPSGKLHMTVSFYEISRRSISDGVHIYGIAQDVNVLSPYKSSSIRYMLYKLRQGIKDAIPFKNEAASAFAGDIILGDIDEISGEFNTILSKIGLSHVTSVSGMHLMFSVMIFDFVMAFFALSHKKRAIMAMFSVLLFTVISGFSVSCLRAAIMIAIYYIGIITGRLSDSLTSLFVSVYLILLFFPQYTGSLSLLLSASATFGIIVLSSCFKSFFRIRINNRWLRSAFYMFVGFLTLSLSACIGCLPVTAALFGEFCVIAPIVNLMLTLPIQIFFYISIFATLFSKIPFLREALSFVGDLIYNLIEFVARKCYYIKNTTVTIGYSFYYIVVALICVLVLGLYVFYKTKRPLKISFVYIGVFTVICTSLFLINILTTLNSVNVHFVDVGDGNCSVITKDESAVIIDCGGEYFSNIERVFCEDNVKRIRLVAITHFNADHVNYLSTLADKYKIDTIIYPKYANVKNYYNLLASASEKGTEVVSLEKDDELLLYDDVKIKWFVQKAANVKNYDNISGIYRLELGDDSVLYTGDMNIYQEHAYLDYSGAMNCDILSVAHHGSKTSSHTDFLNLCSPEYSIISVAKESKTGNPDSTIVKRLGDISKVLQTSIESTVSFKFNKEGYKRIK